MIVMIEVINNGALNLLSDMERLNLIRLNIPSNTKFTYKEKLSKQYAGALKLSDAIYEAYQNYLRESRDEWGRNIY